MKKITFTYLLVCLCMLGCATLNVSPIDLAGKADISEYPGITYALPKHSFDVVVNYEKVSFKRSSFLKVKAFTDQEVKDALEATGVRLGFVTTNQAQKVNYKITGIDIETRIYPDPDHFYFIESKNRKHPFIKKVIAHELTTKGFLTKSNISIENTTVDFVLNTIETAFSVYAGIANPGAAAADAEARIDGVDKKGDADDDDVEKRLKPLYQVLQQIAEIRAQKLKIIYGNVNLSAYSDQPPIGTMVAALEKEEAKLVALISGSKTTTPMKKVYAVSNISNQTLFQFDKTKGLDKGTGVLYSLDVTNHTEDLSTFWTAKSTRIENYDENKGIHYRLPATCLIRVLDASDNEQYRKEHIVPQLGTVMFLPARVGVTKNDLTYTLDPVTGALLKFEANSEGIDMETVKAFNESLAGLPEQLRKEEEEENENEAIENAIKKLELENQLLQLQLTNDSLSSISQ